MQIWKSKVIDELWGVQMTTEEKLINSCDWDEIKEWLALEGGKGLSIDVNDARLRNF